MINPARPCPDTLLARARKGALPPSEQAQLDAHTAQCASCRIAWLVGEDFDASVAAHAGDDVMSARVVDSVLAEVARNAPREALLPRRARVLWLIAAVFLVVTAGFAAGLSRKYLRETYRARAASPVTNQQATHAYRDVSRALPVQPPVPPGSAVTAVDSVEDTPVGPSIVPRRAHVTRPIATSSDPLADPASLFALANSRRRAGAHAQARGLYAQLQRSFPTSIEAVVSHVSLGRLLLDRVGDPRGALAEFDRYLHQHGQTALVAEALFGRAEALAQLGRTSDELRTWRELLQRFPDSVYSVRARARLGGLQ